MPQRLRQQKSGDITVLEPAASPGPKRVSAGSVLRPRTIAGQLARILVLALALALVLLTVTVYNEYSDYREADNAVSGVSLALTAQDLIHEVQRERGLSSGLLGGDNRMQQPLIESRGRVDQRLEELRKAASGGTPGSDQVNTALTQFNVLKSTRAQVDSRRTSRQASFQAYTDAIGALNNLNLGLDQASDNSVRRGLQALYALGTAKEQAAQERGFLAGIFASEGFNGGEYLQFMEIRAAKLSALASFAQYATKSERAQLDVSTLSDNATKAEQAENVALTSSEGQLARRVDSMAWFNQMTGVIDNQRAVQQTVGNDVKTRADDLRGTALFNLIAFLIGAGLAIIAMIVLVVISVRGIQRPLAIVATEAEDVAERRLPEVIDAWLKSGDSYPDPPAPVRTPAGSSVEIEAVASALDNVQTTAFELASQQALIRRNTTESMANLARRNQNLVRRQLNLISEFEREELDPKGLAKLFELDHLATRMRRNAESLLVLTGEGSPRRWAQPIPLTDVIRAGLSEVDDYRRVALRRVDDVEIQGAVVSELAHLFAELIENALAFSPPDLEVEIYGRKVPGGYLLAVVDHGVGMPPDQLATANARLRGEQDFIVSPSRYLGHYVVGRLAQRLGVEVELNVSPVSGIVARVFMPTAVLAVDQDPLAPKQTAVSAGPSPALPSPPPPKVARPAEPSYSEPALAVRGDAVEVHEVPGLAGATGPAGGSVRNGHDPEFVRAAEHSGAYPIVPERRTPAHAAHRDEPGYETGELPRLSDSAFDTSAYSHFVSPVDPPTGAQPVLPNDSSQWRIPQSDSATARSGVNSSNDMGVQRTRNGLVKRNKRSRGSGPDTEVSGTTRPAASGAHADRGPAPDRTPNDVRSMLSSFRAGHERGGTTPDTDSSATDLAQNWPEP